MEPSYRDNARPLVYAVLVHVGLAIVAIVSLNLPSEPPTSAPAEVIQAVVVDADKVSAEIEKLKRAEEQQRREEEARRHEEERKVQEAQQARKREEQRLEEIRKQQLEEQQKLKLAEQKRQEEVKRQAEQQKKRQAEEAQRNKQAEQEKKRAAEEAERKKQAELDKKRKADEAKRREEAERALQEQLAQEQQALEAQRSGRLNALRAQYERDIAQKVERNWPKPATAQPGWSCRVRVTQIPGGEVVGVEAISCNGDAVFKRSVETAVHRASPLPPPPDPALFDREILFTFKPEG